MTWRWVVGLVVAVGLIGGALAALDVEPKGADDVFRRREVASCTCKAVKP